LIHIVAEDENGAALSKGIDVPIELFPRVEDRRFECLRFVDPYGDAIFNTVQLPFLKADLNLVRELNPSMEHVVCSILELVSLCEDVPHRYLRMIGD
jgi:hypothetical protein